jgi:AcrR family transcriptional regulator
VAPEPASTSAPASAPPGYRQRLIAAMATSIAERGYRSSTVAEIVRIARTSRRNFYEHFADREACFLALFEEANEALMAQIAAAVDPGEPLERQVDRALGAYLDNVTSQPELYQSFVRELPALGQPGADRQLAVIERFAQLLVGLVDSGRRAQPELGARPLSMDLAVIVVGGLRELMVISFQQNRDVGALRTSAGDAVKAILNATLL